MTADQSGVLVKDVIYGASAWGVIKPGDVLTSINGTAIANDGTVELRKGERVMSRPQRTGHAFFAFASGRYRRYAYSGLYDGTRGQCFGHCLS